MGSVSLNVHYITLFRQTRDSSQVGVLARQIFGGRAKDFLKIYEGEMSRPYNYILVNIHPANNHAVSVHVNIFPDSGYEVVYI